jgi:hypothetical protein
MKVEAYRDLISAVSNCRNSVVSAPTPHDQRAEVMRLQNAVDELETATCPRRSARDYQWAGYVLGIAETLLAEKRSAFKAADAALSCMAFGEEWR